jgi:hypothetical protein
MQSRRPREHSSSASTARKPVSRNLTTELALVHARQRWLSDGSLADFYLSHPAMRVRSEFEDGRKELERRKKFEQRANADQRQQIRKLWRFHQQAKYGPALATSWKRTRRAMFFDFFSKLPLMIEPPPGYPPPDLPGVCKTLNAVLKAAQRDDDFWSDFAIAEKFRKHRSRVNCFLSDYSLLMLGVPPALTFGELQKILHWIKPTDLRKKIRDLREQYGDFVVPLKRGRPGRPRKNRG